MPHIIVYLRNRALGGLPGALVALCSLCLLFAISPWLSSTASAADPSRTGPSPTEPLSIEIIKAKAGGKVRVHMHNNTDKTVRIWDPTGKSWGWTTWEFQFQSSKRSGYTAYARTSDTDFARNIPTWVTISAKDSITLDFELTARQSWNRQEVAVCYDPSDAGNAQRVSGCTATLSIPETPYTRKYRIWTGIVTSPLKP